MKNLVILLTVLALATSAQAMSLWDVDFESQSTGVAPVYKGTYHSGGGVYEYMFSDDEGGSATNTWTVVDAATYDSDSDTIPEFAAMNSAGLDNIAVLVDNDVTTRPNLHMYGHYGDLLTNNDSCTYYDPAFPGTYKIEFDLMIHSAAETFLGVNLERLGTATSQGGFSFASSNNRLVLTGPGVDPVTVYNAWEL